MIGFGRNTLRWDFKIGVIFLKGNLRISIKIFEHAILPSHSSLRDVLWEIIQDVPKDKSYLQWLKTTKNL